jgi:LysM repeat protein
MKICTLLLCLVGLSLAWGQSGPAWPTTNNAPSRGNDELRQIRAEFAALKGDLRLLQEDLRNMILRVETLEKENAAKDKQLEELRSMVAALDTQLANVERKGQERMDSLKKTVDAERHSRQKEMENMSSAIATEIAGVKNQESRKATDNSKTVEIEVQSGDTLSTIARQTKTTVKHLMELNGLKTTDIRIGQKLKVPLN